MCPQFPEQMSSGFLKRRLFVPKLTDMARWGVSQGAVQKRGRCYQGLLKGAGDKPEISQRPQEDWILLLNTSSSNSKGISNSSRRGKRATPNTLLIRTCFHVSSKQNSVRFPKDNATAVISDNFMHSPTIMSVSLQQTQLPTHGIISAYVSLKLVIWKSASQGCCKP